MSHLLRRTKKSCLKLLRKISASRQLFVQRLEEDDISSNCNIATTADVDGDIDGDGVEASLDGELNDKPNVSNNTNTNTKSPMSNQAVQGEQENASEAAAEEEEQQEEQPCDENQNSHALMHGLTSKFFLGADGYEFRRLRQLRSDAASEIVEWEPDEQLEQHPEYGVRFERVIYRQHVRYLRHTPSNSSLDLQLQQPEAEAEEQPMPIATTGHSEQRRRLVQRPCSVSLGSKFDGNYHNVVIMEPPHDDYPIVKWDINGNSLDDEQFDLKSHWEDFDSRWRRLQRQPQSLRSSHQSSSCTLETWIDDAEQLSGHFEESISNNNNHNLGLKSF